MKILLPIPAQYSKKISQTFQDHVNRAIQNGWWFPGAPYSITGRSTYYGGIDYMVPNGTEVYAAADGSVSRVSIGDSGYGNHIRITHAENFLSIYGHLRSIAVSNLANVKAGDLIGYSDNTGFSTGPHLHFELRKKDVPVDPDPYYGYIAPDPVDDDTYQDLLEDVPTFPGLPMVEVIAEYINVRTSPWGKVIGQVYLGDQIKVQGVGTSPGNEIWLITGHKQFVAQYTPKNGLMAKWV